MVNYLTNIITTVLINMLPFSALLHVFPFPLPSLPLSLPSPFSLSLSLSLLTPSLPSPLFLQLYQPLGVRVTLVYSITWTDEQQIAQTTDSDTVLDLFEEYHRLNTDFRDIVHDSAMLITWVHMTVHVVWNHVLLIIMAIFLVELILPARQWVWLFWVQCVCMMIPLDSLK